MVKLKNLPYTELAEKIRREQKHIIVYGAGVIGQIVIPKIISEWKLEDFLQFFVDADQAKQKEHIRIGDHCYSVKTKADMQRHCKANKNTVILITNSRFYSILEEMDCMEELDHIEVFIIPVMQLVAFQKMKSRPPQKKSDKALIPKVIHYCWFSGNDMPDHLKKCIASWGKYCPDYEIKRWDESNYDISKNTYMKQAYEHEKWGFIPDYARLDILYTYGGFYLDTDVELLKSLDTLRFQQAFCGVEKWGIVNLGGCSGAVSGHPVIKELLEERKNVPFIRTDGSLNTEASGVYETGPLVRAGMQINNKMQEVKGMTIYPFDYFHPYDYMSGELTMTKNTFSIHHFNGGWLDEKEREQRKRTVAQYSQILRRMENEKAGSV